MIYYRAQPLATLFKMQKTKKTNGGKKRNRKHDRAFLSINQIRFIYLTQFNREGG